MSKNGCTFNLTLTNVKIENASREDEHVIVSGPGLVSVKVEKKSDGHYSIPDFRDSITGEFSLDEELTVELRAVTQEEAEKLIQTYIAKNPGLRTSDIICNLGIDVEVGLEALKNLKKKDIVESREIHVSVCS